MLPLRLFLFFGLAISLRAAITNVNVQVSHNQALLVYTAPDSAVCSIKTSPSITLTPLIPDVDPAVFANSNLDSRAGNISTGRLRMFLIGKPTAEVATSGARVGRGLAAHSAYYSEITCNADTYTISFVTKTSPVGVTWNKSVPAAAGGITAWPQTSMTARTPVVDPQTGVELIPITLPGDMPVDAAAGANLVQVTAATGWTNPNNVLANDAAVASFNGAGQNKLFISSGIPISGGATFEALGAAFIPYISFLANAWCSNVGCGLSSAADRTLSACLTGNGTTCFPNSTTVDIVLPECLISCNAAAPSPQRFTIGTGAMGLTDWFPVVSPPMNHVVTTGHAGTVDVVGAVVTRTGGDHFRPQYWGPGTPILINGTPLIVLTVDTDSQITLTTSPGDVTGADYTVKAFGVLIWKKTTSAAETFSVQWIGQTYQRDYEQQKSDSAMTDFNLFCASDPVIISGATGYLCGFTAAYYWISPTTRTIKYLGQWQVPGVSAGGGYAGNGPAICDPTLLDTSATVVWCYVQNRDGDHSLWTLTYFGDYGVTPVAQGTVPPACNGGHSNTPCFDFVRVEDSVEAKVRTAFPLYAAWCCPRNGLSIAGRTGGGQIYFQVNAGIQDNTGWFFVYDPGTLAVTAGRSTYDYYPMGWSGWHSIQVWKGALIGMPLGDIGNGSPGPLTGLDASAGHGPNRVKIALAMGTTLQLCPARPVNSVIPASVWPTGLVECVTVVTDGEPCDPSPYYYVNVGTVTTDGSVNVVGTGTLWIKAFNGKPIVINGNTYTLTNIVTDGSGNSTGTLSSAAPAFGPGNYTIQAEPPGGSSCGTSTDFHQSDAKVGDPMFVGQPTTGITGYGAWQTVNNIQPTEAFRLLIKSGNTWTLQRRIAPGSYLGNWPVNTWLYMGSGLYNYTGNYYNSFGWNYLADPTGALGVIVTDTDPPQGHGYINSASTSGIYDHGAGCLPQTAWFGGSFTQCYFSRWGLDGAYVNDPGVYMPWAPYFNGESGMGYANPRDDHPYYSMQQSSKKEFMQGSVINGTEGASGTTASPGALISGSLYKFTAAQRGCAVPAATRCRTLDKTLMVFGWCGISPMINVSSPAPVLGGTAADNFKFLVANTNAESAAIGSGTAPPDVAGDLYINCPGASLKHSATPAIGANGGDTIDMTVGYGAAWNHGVVRTNFDGPAPNGERAQWLGSTLSRYRFYSPYWNVRETPDGKAVMSQVVGLDGYRTAAVLSIKPPYVQSRPQSQYNNEMKVQISAKSGSDGARVRFGLNPNFNCTDRAEACLTDSVIAPFAWASESLTATSCAAGCTIPVPVIRGNGAVYYRVERLSGSTVTETGGTNIIFP